MTLENLLAIHRLQQFEATPESVLRLLASAELLSHTRAWLQENRPDLLAGNR